MVKDYRILSDDAVLTTDINRSKFPPWGVDGGQNGTLNYLAVIRDDKEIMRVSRLMNHKLKKSDVVSIRTAGGGGWGHPYERDPSLVADDVRKDLVTIDQARDIYGVVVKPETLDIDIEATRRLRATKPKDES